MRVKATQRWLFGDEYFRPADEPVRARDWEVVRVTKDAEAKAFVEAHHYSGKFVAARERFSLVHLPTQRVGGFAIYDVPAQPRCLDVLPGEAQGKLHFGRMVCLPWVPGMGESLLIGGSMRQLARRGYTGVVSFADPAPRTRADGTIIHPGHVGIIYQATNGRLVGRSKPDTIWLLPDGTQLHRRARSKVRRLEQGWRYVVAELVAAGAPQLQVEDESEASQAKAAAWLDEVMKALCRPLPHPGNWKYVWGLDRSSRRHLEKTTLALPYPAPPGGRVPPKWGRRVRLDHG